MTDQILINLKQQAKEIRRSIVEMLVPTESHHIGCSLGIVNLLTVLYGHVLQTNPKQPKDPLRDIFILSKGHGAAALYATLCNMGFIHKELLSTYDRNGGYMPEHASVTVPGVEVSTGSLGHGLPIGCGFSISFRNDNKKNKTFVLMSDGELNEGSNWESIMFAGHHKLSNLIAIVDLNGFQGYSTTEKVIDLLPLEEKLINFRWDVHSVNGNSIGELVDVFDRIDKGRVDKPHIIIARTVKGFGVSYFEGKFESHYKSVDEKTKEEILSELNS